MRSQGRGTRRADGRWQSGVTLPTGERRYVYADTQAELLTAIAALRRAIAEGKPTAVERRSVAEYLAEWLETSRPRVKHSTWLRYETVVRKQLTPQIGKVQLGRLTARDVERMYARLLASGLAPNTVKHGHMVLHHALKQAHRQRLLPENVADLVSPPRVPRYEAETLSAAQARQLLEAVRGDPLEAVFVLALHTSKRQGEILGLRWRDVDLERGRLQLRMALGPGREHRLELTETKRGKSQSVLLTRAAVEALRRRRDTQTTQRLMAGAEWQESELVFTTRTGSLVDPWRLREKYYRVLKREGLPRVNFHALRHTCATLLLEEGVHPKAVADLLGHSTVQLTMDRYSHVSEGIQQTAIEALDRLFPTDER